VSQISVTNQISVSQEVKHGREFRDMGQGLKNLCFLRVQDRDLLKTFADQAVIAIDACASDELPLEHPGARSFSGMGRAPREGY
jgi:hypothetical protein